MTREVSWDGNIGRDDTLWLQTTSKRSAQRSAINVRASAEANC